MNRFARLGPGITITLWLLISLPVLGLLTGCEEDRKNSYAYCIGACRDNPVNMPACVAACGKVWEGCRENSTAVPNPGSSHVNQ
jgi:hypothetical protein